MTKAPLEKVTINIFIGDKETLADFFPASGWSVAARHIINNYCNELRKKTAKIETTPISDLEIKIGDVTNDQTT